MHITYIQAIECMKADPQFGLKIAHTVDPYWHYKDDIFYFSPCYVEEPSLSRRVSSGHLRSLSGRKLTIFADPNKTYEFLYFDYINSKDLAEVY